MSSFPKDDWAEQGRGVVFVNASAAERIVHWTAEVAKAAAVHAERPDPLTRRLLDAARAQLAACGGAR